MPASASGPPLLALDTYHALEIEFEVLRDE
jgi:hypothetical protein